MENWVTLRKTESYGELGAFGLEIKISATKLPDLNQKNIQIAAYQAEEIVSAEIQNAIKANDPRTLNEIAQNKELVSLFLEPIFVEEIPNGYCSKWCCRHLPWFVVTTIIGRFTIGWRKRVIHIDWSETIEAGSSEDLFKDETTTKGKTFIHAWGMEKAKEYINIIINSAQGKSP